MNKKYLFFYNCDAIEPKKPIELSPDDIDEIGYLKNELTPETYRKIAEYFLSCASMIQYPYEEYE